MSCAVAIACAHEAPPGIVTLGQFAGKPICAGIKSSPPPQSLSAPPHALQMAATFFDSAFAIAGAALAASGHGPAVVPLRTPSSHFCSALFFAKRNLVAS